MTTQHENRSGIALVIVLAFLTILLLLAISFVTLMRTERIASRNYSDIVRARQFAQTGLARAIQDIDDVLVGNPPLFPAWANRSFYSAGTLGENRTIHELGARTVRSYFPFSNSVWTAATVSDIGTGSVEWDEVLDPLDPTLLLGRISYWAFDCTGLLDVTAVYSQAVVRGTGISPGEIRLDPTMSSVLGPDQLWTNLGRYARFASISELASLGPTNGFLDANNPPQVQNFIDFSYSPTGYWDSAVGPGVVKVPIPLGAVATAENRAAIRALVTLPPYSLTAPQAEQFIANLIDYVDTDRTPANNLVSGTPLNSICTEAVPMINEVTITNRVGFSGTGTNLNYVNTLDIGVELWYPFPTVTDAAAYTVRCVVNGPEPFLPQIPAPQQEQAVPGGAFPGGNSGLRTLPRFRAIRTISATSQPAFPTLVEIVITVLRQGAPVDELRVREEWPARFLTAFPPTAGEIGERVLTKECVDPRINWEWATQWQAGGPSMGSINAAASAVYAGKDGSWEMYVANGAPTNTGEIGFLLYDAAKPWDTIPLYGANAWPVWTHFTARTTPLITGLVNPKTTEQEVLAAVFNGVRADKVPGLAGAAVLNWTQAMAIADKVKAVMLDPTRVNVGDLASLTDMDLAVLGLGTRLERKAVLRNSADLFSTRQQVITIIAEGQAVSDADGNGTIEPHEILASQKALAVIWRDPFRLEPTFTQYFEWLTD